MSEKQKYIDFEAYEQRLFSLSNISVLVVSM